MILIAISVAVTVEDRLCFVPGYSSRVESGSSSYSLHIQQHQGFPVNALYSSMADLLVQNLGGVLHASQTNSLYTCVVYIHMFMYAVCMYIYIHIS